MKDAASDIASFAVGKSLEQFAGDKQFRMAVERGFELVGEALSQLRKIDPTTAERITDYQAIIGFRNVLIHGYAHVNTDKTWDILQTELPLLRSEVDQLLAEGEAHGAAPL